MGKAKECIKQQEEGKISEQEVMNVQHRVDTVSYGTLAEMNHFQRERVQDFKLMMQLYLRSQIQFYQDVSISIYDLCNIKPGDIGRIVTGTRNTGVFIGSFVMD